VGSVLAAELDAALDALGERGEVSLDSGLTYGGGLPVVVVIRKRPRGSGGWLELADDGRAVEAAGRPAGWLRVAEHVVAELDLNVNRRGVVFVASPGWRDDEWLHSLAERVADASLAVYEALLELDD
jgi:hypothetical protein